MPKDTGIPTAAEIAAHAKAHPDRDGDGCWLDVDGDVWCAPGALADGLLPEGRAPYIPFAVVPWPADGPPVEGYTEAGALTFDAAAIHPRGWVARLAPLLGLDADSPVEQVADRVAEAVRDREDLRAECLRLDAVARRRSRECGAADANAAGLREQLAEARGDRSIAQEDLRSARAEVDRLRDYLRGWHEWAHKRIPGPPLPDGDAMREALDAMWSTSEAAIGAWQRWAEKRLNPDTRLSDDELRAAIDTELEAVDRAIAEVRTMGPWRDPLDPLDQPKDGERVAVLRIDSDGEVYAHASRWGFHGPAVFAWAPLPEAPHASERQRLADIEARRAELRDELRALAAERDDIRARIG